MDFESEFVRNRKTYIRYKGETIYLVKKLNIPRGYLEVQLLESDNRFIQGVVFTFLDTDVGFLDKLFKLNKKYGTSIRIWHKDDKYKYSKFMILKDTRITVYNTWDDNGSIKSTRGGAAMEVKKIESNKYLFRCNDGYLDEDFNDLVFTLKIIPESEVENFELGKVKEVIKV